LWTGCQDFRKYFSAAGILIIGLPTWWQSTNLSCPKKGEEDFYVATVFSAKTVFMGIEQNSVLRVVDLGLLVPVFGFQPGDPGGITLAAP
jgi:hypothetical protein